MKAKEVREIMEAYASMYSQVKEKLDEVKVATTTQNDRIPNFETEKKAKQVPGLRVNKPSSPVEEEVDLFDYLLEYLVAEGYADTNKAALAIMANMSEEWRQSIVEQMTGGPTDSPSDNKTWNKGQTLKDPRAQKIYNKMTGPNPVKLPPA
jgi:hypothetical protein